MKYEIERKAVTTRERVFYTPIKPMSSNDLRQNMGYKYLVSPYFSIESRKYEDEFDLLLMVKAKEINLDVEEKADERLIDTLYLHLDKTSKHAHLGPKGRIITTYKGVGVGSALSKALLIDIQPYRDKLAEVSFSRVSLSTVDAHSEKIHKEFCDNKEKHQNFTRRTKFYKKLGFNVEVDNNGDGLGKIESLEELVSADDYKLMKGTSFVDPQDLVETGLEKDKKIAELSCRLKGHKDSLDFLKKENHELFRYKAVVWVTLLLGAIYVLNKLI